MVDLQMIKSVKAFNSLTDKQLELLHEDFELLEYEAGDKLFTEGDDAEHLWIIIKGQVDLRFEMPDKRPTSSDHTVSNIDVHEQQPESKVLGWSCFVPPYKMRLSAYCVTPTCSVVRIGKEKLFEIFDEHPEVGYKILSYIITVVGFRFHQFQDHVAQHLGEDLMSGW